MTPHHLLALTLIYAPLVVFFAWTHTTNKMGKYDPVKVRIFAYILVSFVSIITGISLL